jgi:asparagine synthase (glutamine-hydrolysing)
MCGFAGIVSWDDRHRVHRAVLENMSARIAHRGPDDQGLWINHSEEASPGRPQVGLAFRRLAIIDLDPRANQPFTDGRGRWLVFNGEIYNYRELRRELEGVLPDYAWRTQGDAEVLLASYAAWGEKCVEKLNGMFAFAIWDENKGELFLARDRMGQKPLYVAVLPNQYGKVYVVDDEIPPPAAIAFGSEVGALLEISAVDRSIGHEEVANYLKYGYVTGTFPPDNTIYRGIRQLWPAASVRVSASRYQGEQYYLQSRRDGLVPRSSDPRVSDDVAVAGTRARVRTAVERQMVADVPVGCFLSGGVDSSVIAGVMSRAAGGADRVHTFSIGFDDPRYDESSYARRVAEHLGTRHHEFRVRPDAARVLPELAAAFGEPFGDSSALPSYHLAQQTRAHVKVALSGDGGDEVFSGYDRYRALALSRRLRTWLTPVPWFYLSKLMSRMRLGHPKSRWTRFKRFAMSVGTPEEHRYAGYLRLFPTPLLRELIAFDPPQNLLFDSVVSHFAGWHSDPVRYALYVDRDTYLPHDLLTKVDRCSMRHALEVRSPFMDHELIEFAAQFRAPQLLKGGPKRMLREAFADLLPAWVFKRKKMGFAVPIGEWFRGELRPMLHDHLFAADSFAAGHFNTAVVRRLVEEHEAERVDHSQRLYALLMLELWWKQQKP